MIVHAISTVAAMSSKEQMACMCVCADDTAEMLAPAGSLLSALWQVHPPLVTKFVSSRNLPALLKQASRNGHVADCLTVLRLVHQVWSFTASLVSEPLLLQAIPAIVLCCGAEVHQASDVQTNSELQQLQADLQVHFVLPASLPPVCVSDSAPKLALTLPQNLLRALLWCLRLSHQDLHVVNQHATGCPMQCYFLFHTHSKQPPAASCLAQQALLRLSLSTSCCAKPSQHSTIRMRLQAHLVALRDMSAICPV